MSYLYEVANVKESDVESIKIWWKWWRFGDVHRLMLPDDISDSIMIKYQGVNFGCGFIYRTSASRLFHIEFIVTDYKFKDKKVRKFLIDKLVSELIKKTCSMGAVVIYMNLKHKSLTEHLKNNGFIVGSKDTQEMVYLNTL